MQNSQLFLLVECKWNGSFAFIARLCVHERNEGGGEKAWENYSQLKLLTKITKIEHRQVVMTSLRNTASLVTALVYDNLW